MRNIISIIGSLIIIALAGCKSHTQVDMIFYNATIYSVDSAFSKHAAMAVKDGKIAAVGTKAKIFELYDAPEKIDLQGKTVLPGLYDAHTHFYYYALGLREVDLTGTRRFNEAIQRVQEFSTTS
jgi:predicted amidohydrolase YtcJ